MLGAAQTQLLSVVAQLRLADLVHAGTTSLADLAAATGTAVPVLSHVMHALSRLGLFVKTAPQQFACTPVGALLQSDTPDSLREYAIHFGHPVLFRTWPHLLHSVHTSIGNAHGILALTHRRRKQRKRPWDIPAFPARGRFAG
jgi:hypothetical protein